MARPVRLLMAPALGGDIDGAWWPYTGSVAQELPELIESLHKPLGEIVDICIRRPRLMFVDGKDGCAKLLVVPHMTSAGLGSLVMRCAAAMPADGLERNDQYLATADLVVRTAQVESANWAVRMRA